MKTRLAVFCRQWGRDRAKRLRGAVALWSAELQALWRRGPPFLERDRGRIAILQGLLKEHYVQAARSFLLSAGVQWRFAEEVPSKAFFAAARKQQSQVSMEEVVGLVGPVTDLPGILGVARDFYCDLFQARASEEQEAKAFLECLEGRLPEAERSRLDGAISWEEVEEAMRSLKMGSAPGCDGLPIEVYKAFWPQMGPDLLEVFNESLAHGQLPLSMRTGHVTLLYKKGPRELLSNWRPITLLTADYKILAKVITRRLGSVLGSVVHPDQTCGVPGRTCSLNLVLVRDAISWAEQRNLPLALLGLDQEKAFDRVSHAFLFKVLERLVFGPVFRSWVELLYAGAMSRIKIQGSLSEPVWQVGGVRQGCPLSPLLYILSLEPLVARFRADPRLVGLHLPGGQGVSAKVSAYADDLTLFITTRGGFSAVAENLVQFGRAAGSKVNLQKSAAMGFGGWAALDAVPAGFRVEGEKLRVLGVDFYRQDSALRNWEALLSSISRRLGLWRSRPLSLTGRVVAIKADIMP